MLKIVAIVVIVSFSLTAIVAANPYCKYNETVKVTKEIQKTRYNPQKDTSLWGTLTSLFLGKKTVPETYWEPEEVLETKVVEKCCDGYQRNEQFNTCEPICQPECGENFRCVELNVCKCIIGYIEVNDENSNITKCEFVTNETTENVANIEDDQATDTLKAEDSEVPATAVSACDGNSCETLIPDMDKEVNEATTIIPENFDSQPETTTMPHKINFNDNSCDVPCEPNIFKAEEPTDVKETTENSEPEIVYTVPTATEIDLGVYNDDTTNTNTEYATAVIDENIPLPVTLSTLSAAAATTTTTTTTTETLTTASSATTTATTTETSSSSEKLDSNDITLGKSIAATTLILIALIITFLVWFCKYRYHGKYYVDSAPNVEYKPEEVLHV